MNSTQFFTQEEIISQPGAWHQTLGQLAKQGLGDFPGIQHYQQVLFVGCGSTYYLSIWAARAIQAATGVLCRALPSSELMLFPDAWLTPNEETLLVALSRSGETSETLEALDLFKARGHSHSLAITCYPESTLAARCQYLVGLPAGQERSVAQTRSFTNMMMGVASLAQGAPSAAVVESVPMSARELLRSVAPIAEELGRDGKLQRFFYLGSHALYGLASEAMLKMKEMSLSYAEAFHFLEFRHGPMSMVSGESLVIGLLGQPANDYEMAVLRDMKALGAKLVALAPQGALPAANPADHLITFPNTGAGIWAEALYLPALQLMAYERAVANGLNPDRPENLEAVVVIE